MAKADQEALAEAGLFGVKKSKNCVEVLTSDDDDDDDGGEPDYGGEELPAKRALSSGSGAVGDRMKKLRLGGGDEGGDVSGSAYAGDYQSPSEGFADSADSQSTIGGDLE